jgi:hypothetical protein
MERRTGGAYFAEAVLTTRDTPDSLPVALLAFSSIGSVIALARRPRDSAIGLVELFLWGPRQILEAFRIVRGVSIVARANRGRASAILSVLQARDHPDVPVLVPASDAEGGLAVAYLLWYGWIGCSKNANRVWLDSESRKFIECGTDPSGRNKV